MDNKTLNKRGQVAIWVIVSVAIVAIIILLFYLLGRGGEPIVETNDELNPEAFIERCVRDAVKEAVDIMIPQGGFINPRNYKLYEDTKVEYLCKNSGYYRPCINQHPMFLNEMKQEIINYTAPIIEQCFQDLRNSWEKRDYQVSLGSMNLEVSYGPKRVFLDVQRELKLSKNNEIQSFDIFNTDIISPLYDLGLVAIEIAAQEAKYCYFEYVGYQIIYPRFDIRKTSLSDSTKIYEIRDKQTNKELKIAIRSCAIPPGI